MERIISESAAISLGLVNNHPFCTDTSTRPKTPEIRSIPALAHIIAHNELDEEEIELKSYCYKEPGTTLSTTIGSLEVISRIETIVGSVIDSLLQKQKSISIPIKVKKQPPKVGMESSAISAPPPGWTRVLVSFPGRNIREASRFAVLWRIIGLVLQALRKGVVVSKRNIYYNDPALFKSQRVVDRYIDILAYSLGVQRADLNVTAAAKGLVAGSFSATRRNGMVHSETSISATSLIDEVDDIVSIDTSGAAWVLVVEKESTFRTLASSRSHQISRAGKGIIITAKGYPDLSTRAFLHLVSTPKDPRESPPPIYALVDFDPDGINIMFTYKHGSWNLSHESLNHNVPSIHWLGPKSEDLLFHSNGDESRGGMVSVTESAGLLRLSIRDRRRAVGMLKKNPLEENGLENEWRRELQVMLILGLKGEMELLGDWEGGLEAWVEQKLMVEIEKGQGNA